MSVRVMSLVFECRLQDLTAVKENGDTRVVKASTAKFVLLALADHANDEGKSAYPSITTLARKTSIRSRSTLVDALDALEQAGYISRGEISERDTTTYALHMGAIGSPATVPSPASHSKPVQPLERTSPKAVHEPSFNHPIKPSVKEWGEKNAPLPELHYEDVIPETTSLKTKSKVPPSAVKPMQQALGQVLGFDMRISSNYSRVGKLAQDLVRAKYKPEQVTRIYGSGGAWFSRDWRGKKGEMPDMKSIPETIATLSKAATDPTQERLRQRIEALADGN